MGAVFQPDGGYVRSEVAIRAYAAAACTLGAEIVAETTVRGWERHPAGVRVDTEKGAYEARKLVITAGHGSVSSCPACACAGPSGRSCSGPSR